ncbi:MAG: peptidoglycan-associated lipoprotein Pal [Rickettsiales bacterium]|jgi:peptidoglycan-associated lipoprotein|nr:peptidoglycan-associated lipoprotein Pal [Rickettsiales bacterium]
MKKKILLLALVLFISACGGKKNPAVEEIIKNLVSNPTILKAKNKQAACEPIFVSKCEARLTSTKDIKSKTCEKAKKSACEEVVKRIEKPTVSSTAELTDDRVYFDYDKYNLRSDAISTLRKQVVALKSEKGKITIEGHCDERGTREYNIALGAKRANAVKSYLVKNGVPSAKIKTISYGKDRPIVKGSDEESWAKNRTAITLVK